MKRNRTDYITDRVLEIAKYTLSENATVREAAEVFGVSKSTVHLDLTQRLPKINPLIAAMVNEVIEVNKAERHVRGGIATRESYQRKAE